MSTAISAALDAWRDSMDEHGHIKGEPHCLGCGRKLNADGYHPAETYGGTYNGLCYGCTKKGSFVLAVAVLDGCRKISYPPHCPSWRRDREVFYGYPGCETCSGQGVSSIGREGYRTQCKACLDQCMQHPLRARDQDWRWRLESSIRRSSRYALLRALGVPKRASGKAENAALEQLSEEIKDQVRREMGPRVMRLRALARARAERTQVNVWLPPALWTTAADRAA